jgi:hypothetical protein
MAMTTTDQRSILKIQKPGEVPIYYIAVHFFKILEFNLVAQSL